MQTEIPLKIEKLIQTEDLSVGIIEDVVLKPLTKEQEDEQNDFFSRWSWLLGKLPCLVSIREHA